jgi:hypothetical protein
VRLCAGYIGSVSAASMQLGQEDVVGWKRRLRGKEAEVHRGGGDCMDENMEEKEVGGGGAEEGESERKEWNFGREGAKSDRR